MRLLELPDVEKVHCFIRGEDPHLRLQKSLKQRGLAMNKTSKLPILNSDVISPNLGLDASTYDLLLSDDLRFPLRMVCEFSTRATVF